MKAIVVGAGHWHAPWHVAALRRRRVDIVGVWDSNPHAAAARASEWECPSFTSAEELLSNTSADVAVLAPRAVDAPLLLTLLIDAGLPVIAEKPLGLDAEQVDRLAELVAKRGAFVTVTLVNRLSPVWAALGSSSIVTADFRIVNGTPLRYRDDGVGWVLDPLLSGGGALRNLGIHGADAICAMSGDHELTVESVALTWVPNFDVEVHSTAVVRSAAGWTATVEAGYVLPDSAGSDFEWRVAGVDRYLIDRDTEFTISDAAGTSVQPTASSAERYDAFIGRALDDIDGGRPPLVGVSDVARAARLIDDIYATAAAASPTTLQRTGER